jgi:protein-L-isoaspartate(D-aspartate) O-methyltransferase
MQGVEDEGELSGPVTKDELVTLHWDRDQAVEIDALRGVLDQPRVTAWSGITIASNESHDGLWLRLAVTDPRVCRIKVHADVPPEVCDPIGGWWRMALVDGDTLVYLTARRLKAGDDVCWGWELGAIGHGPAAAELTEHLCDEIRLWGPERNQRTPSLIVYPAGTPDSELAGPAIEKNPQQVRPDVRRRGLVNTSSQTSYDGTSCELASPVEPTPLV